MYKSTFSILFVLAIILTALAPQALHAQERAALRGVITGGAEGQERRALVGANVLVLGTNLGASTDVDGRFSLSSVPPGTHEVRFTYIGYRERVETVTLQPGQTLEMQINLEPSSFMMEGIRVTALSPNLEVDATMEQSDVREANPRDSGELLRSVSGVGAVRRGPVGLDPVVRGLRETEVGTYLDGTRIFPGGPARMDSPLSHLDPSTISSIEVVKGPYALTWGAGNMSAIRVQTQQLRTLNRSFGGNVSSGYDSNFNTFEESFSVQGRLDAGGSGRMNPGDAGDFGYLLSGAWRTGSDYTTGDGVSVPADYLSREIRGKAGYGTGENSWLTLSAGYQNQENIDYPGRLLDADYFDAYNLAADWELRPEEGLVSAVNAKLYLNQVDHGMDNDDKPTAQPAPGRMPPFGLDVEVDAQAKVVGGRLAAELDPAGDWHLEAGGDFYSAYREATRYISRRDNGMLMFTDFMWPQATINDVGIFTRATHTFSDRLSATGTVRLDLVSADADTVSTFFRDNVSGDLASSETSMSASATLNYLLGDHWSLGLGAGSVTRTADATERYSDRIPASKAQTSAEFVGNPELDPERSLQADLWLEGEFAAWTLSLNAFVRRMDDYITLEPTELPKRLPLSPSTVYRYVNGSAQFHGFDLSTVYRLAPEWRLKTGVHYLWGEDTELDEPALGVAPPGADLGLRYEGDERPLFVEGTLHLVGEQDRVAVTRGETSTDGYMTADLQAGYTFWERVSVQAGVKNVLDENYVNHLNAKNPFTGMQIPEPGRVFFLDVNVQF
ncbi:MAG: TonB-dependent receptor [Balneolaceae bacterium]|nr:TonB-dependent receptor [Balneolaceae bacterium]